MLFSRWMNDYTTNERAFFTLVGFHDRIPLFYHIFFHNLTQYPISFPGSLIGQQPVVMSNLIGVSETEKVFLVYLGAAAEVLTTAAFPFTATSAEAIPPQPAGNPPFHPADSNIRSSLQALNNLPTPGWICGDWQFIEAPSPTVVHALILHYQDESPFSIPSDFHIYERNFRLKIAKTQSYFFRCVTDLGAINYGQK